MNIDEFQVYIDQDGVLADFEGSIGCINRYPRLNNLRNEIWGILPQVEGLEQYGMKAWFRDNMDFVRGNKDALDAYRKYKAYSNMFYSHCGAQGFFADLDLFPGAQELVEGVIEIGQGKLPMVLTAPVQTAWCAPEKEAWIKKHFPNKFSRFICQKNKSEFAAPGSVLVDDLLKNTVPWMENGGGLAVLYTGDVASAHKQIQGFYDKMASSSVYR